MILVTDQPPPQAVGEAALGDQVLWCSYVRRSDDDPPLFQVYLDTKKRLARLERGDERREGALLGQAGRWRVTLGPLKIRVRAQKATFTDVVRGAAWTGYCTIAAPRPPVY